MKCHYEILGVGQKATDDELKKSYRKLALQWHPDKNPDNLDEAKSQFQLIQAAYEVLSDPHERAFYDRNRESILRGKASGGTTKAETVDLFAFFTASCYKGFNDNEKGFYTIYRNLFDQITANDMEYFDDDDDNEMNIPTFGYSTTDLEDVAQFYGYWTSYCSRMSFAWEDTYDVRQAPNRWVEKKIEKENKKVRDKARKTYNEEVRSLVFFVRKRDKRWLARKKQMEERVAENARKQEAEQNRLREERQILLAETMEDQKENLAAYEDQLKAMEAQFASEWGVESDKEDEDNESFYDVGSDIDEDAPEEEDYDDLICIVCDKTFKTKKSKESHERSKKHKDNVETLKIAMADEDYLFDDDDLIDKADSKTEENQPQSRSSKKKKKKKNKRNQQEDNNQEKSEDSNIASVVIDANSSATTEIEVTCTNKPTQKLSNNCLNPDDSIIIDDNISSETNNLDNKDLDTYEQESQRHDAITDDNKPKLKGKKAKDARKAAKQSTTESAAHEATELPKTAACSVCNQEFPSRTKLFNHIKSSGHAVIKYGSSSKSTGKKKGKSSLK